MASSSPPSSSSSFSSSSSSFSVPSRSNKDDRQKKKQLKKESKAYSHGLFDLRSASCFFILFLKAFLECSFVLLSSFSPRFSVICGSLKLKSPGAASSSSSSSVSSSSSLASQPGILRHSIDKNNPRKQKPLRTQELIEQERKEEEALLAMLTPTQV